MYIPIKKNPDETGLPIEMNYLKYLKYLVYLVWFHSELVKDKFNAMSGSGGKVPNAVRIWRIAVRIVGTVDGAKCSWYLEFA